MDSTEVQQDVNYLDYYIHDSVDSLVKEIHIAEENNVSDHDPSNIRISNQLVVGSYELVSMVPVVIINVLVGTDFRIVGEADL